MEMLRQKKENKEFNMKTERTYIAILKCSLCFIFPLAKLNFDSDAMHETVRWETIAGKGKAVERIGKYTRKI